ncbi:MAG: hypothetical protein KDA86_02965 [Planctomycetaceae bacterium]|nr:hypothetical protein [Planctomycetaceae bacterium]MCA9110594.1 hypothetical protein [Planctomycetaceae bacterium]
MASSDKPTAVHFTLIFFVMATLILAVMTYLNWRDLKDVNASLETTKADLGKANTGIANRIAEIDAMKEALGYNFPDVGAAGSAGTVLGQLSTDLASFGRDLQEPTVAATAVALRTRISQLESELLSTQQSLEEVQSQLLAVQSRYQGQVDEIQKSQQGSESNLQKNIADRDEVVRQKDAELTQLRSDYNTAKVQIGQLGDQMESMRRGFEEDLAELTKFNTQLRQELDQVNRVSFEVPDGKIRRVDNNTRTVWLNLGDADSLRTQTTFSVYDQDHHGVGRGPEDIKGRVEVVRILGPHLSQARILEEDLVRPMSEEDVVYSPVWSAGVTESFAFVGEIDFDGDGQSDRDQLHDILEQTGAKISVEIDDEGYRIPEDAEITKDTKFLVKGYFPDPADYASEDPNRERINRMQEQASLMEERALRQGVRILSLNEFLAFMGYRPTQRLFLPGSNMPYTLRGGNEDAIGNPESQYSTGQTSELFRRPLDSKGNAVKPGTRNYGN